jgi:hypothetical protein
VLTNSKRYAVAIMLIVSSMALSLANSDEAPEKKLTEVNEQFESWQMSILAKIQTTPGFTIQPFTTDGCSGGMSEAWHFIAGTIPAFASRYGNKPPWESCCVEHDKAYWRGETENGYEKRLAADKQLQQCVFDFGKQHAQEYAEKYDLQIATVEQNFSIAADLMYHAVRVGGKPCSFLPWRWGYGWPQCIADS